jgi:hypothetical protein
MIGVFGHFWLNIAFSVVIITYSLLYLYNITCHEIRQIVCGYSEVNHTFNFTLPFYHYVELEKQMQNKFDSFPVVAYVNLFLAVLSFHFAYVNLFLESSNGLYGSFLILSTCSLQSLFIDSLVARLADSSGI